MFTTKDILPYKNKTVIHGGDNLKFEERKSQNAVDFRNIKSPFAIHKMQQHEELRNEAVEETEHLNNTDTPPPSYKCIASDFLMDEPPEYTLVTGVAINVAEVLIVTLKSCRLNFL